MSMLRRGTKFLFCKPPGGAHEWFDKFNGSTFVLTENIDWPVSGGSVLCGLCVKGQHASGEKLYFMAAWIKPIKSGFAEWFKEHGL